MIKKQSIEDECLGKQAFAAVFADFESELLYFAMRYVKNYELAEDIVQDAFLKLYPRFGMVENPRAWLYRTVRNLALNHKRFNKKIVEFPSIAGDIEDGKDCDRQPDQDVEYMELVGLARIYLEELDSRTRKLIQLRFEEGLSYKEIAQRLNITASNVGYLLHRSVKILAAKLSKHEGAAV